MELLNQNSQQANSLLNLNEKSKDIRSIFEEMFLGSNNQIKDTDKEVNMDFIIGSLINACEQYFGYSPDSERNILKECYYFIERNFMTLGPNEIPVAFECAAMKRFEFDIYKYKRMSITFIADLLTAYSKYRNILLMEKLNKVDNSRSKTYEEIDRLNLRARIHAMAVMNDAKQKLEENGEAVYSEYQEIPMYFGKILKEFGKIDFPRDVKKQMYEKAKKDALRNISSGRNSFNAYSAESARKQTKNILSGIESPDHQRKTESNYAKLFVWYYITGFVN
jgi:hypothetical protein